MVIVMSEQDITDDEIKDLFTRIQHNLSQVEIDYRQIGKPCDAWQYAFGGSDLRLIAKLIAHYNRTRDMQWVSVEDRLPEDRSFVDVWCGAERWSDIEFANGVFSHLVVDDDGDYSYSVDINPTHWMPLPTRPTQDEGVSDGRVD